MRKLKKVEKTLVELLDLEKYIGFDCKQHGLNLQRADVSDGKCAYCKEDCENKHEQLKDYKSKL